MFVLILAFVKNGKESSFADCWEEGEAVTSTIDTLGGIENFIFDDDAYEYGVTGVIIECEETGYCEAVYY